MFKLVLLFLIAYLHGSDAYLTVNGKSLEYDGKKIFLSGANIAWNELGKDWGNGKYWEHRTKMNEWLAGISANGGNVARVWLHFSGDLSPQFDDKGYVIGTDAKGDLIKELEALMDDAQKHNVFIILCMFTTSIFKNHSGFIYDDAKVQSYIDEALHPMVTALKGKHALAAWEIMNEPEGGMDINHKEDDTNTCWDTTRWHSSNKGMGFQLKFPIKRIMRFFNWISAGIHSADPVALVTVGSWNPRTMTNKCDNCFNLYSDECLHAAGGKENGKLDFYQMHTYEWSAEFPIKNKADYYGLNKPLIIGEFSTKRSGVSDSAVTYKHYYSSGYAGCLSWQYNDHTDNDRDSRDVINHGMQSIRNETSNGEIAVKIA